tara:strand:- start:710 stop:940 length:231 start_codon:yes stop_codon:yes gene_type:complete
MHLDSFNINQHIKVKGKSTIGNDRIIQHGDIWRIKNKFKKGYLPWIKDDSILLESTKDRTTAEWFNIIEDKHFQLI